MTLAAAGDGPWPAQDAGGAAARSAPVVVERPGDDPRELLERVGLGGPPRPVMFVSGGADDLRADQLAAARSVLGPAVRAAVVCTGAAIVDGGTDAGVMRLLGAERAREPTAMPVLLGVAPAGKVAHGEEPGDDRTPLAHDHTHFVLADSAEWGGETALLTALAAELARGAPVVVLLVGGGEGSRGEVQEAVARRWPVFAIAGTGGLADEIAPHPPAQGRVRRRLHDLARRVRPVAPGPFAGGDIRRAAAADPDAIGRELSWELQVEPTLKDAWAMFASYDGLAVGSRRTFERFQFWALLLGVLATVIALAHDGVRPGAARDWLHWGAVIGPIVVATLIALANRRGAGKRWILLRAAAEAVKSDIYRCRTRTGPYSYAALSKRERTTSRPERLAERLAEIDAGLIQTAASGGPLTPYRGPLPPPMYGAEARDDGLSDLDAKRYLAIRVGDQLAYYRGKVAALDRRRGRLQFMTLAAGGAGAVLAAAGAEIWVGATTALAGAALAQLGYLQVDNTIVTYNQAASQLDALQRDLRARNAAAIDLEAVVERGETVLTTELGGWVAQMNDALAELQAQQSEAAATVEQARDDSAARR